MLGHDSTTFLSTELLPSVSLPVTALVIAGYGLGRSPSPPVPASKDPMMKLEVLHDEASLAILHHCLYIS